MPSPTHQTIAHRAHQLWQDYGQPSGRDTAIWLEAEQQTALGASGTQSSSMVSTAPVAHVATFGERTRSEAAAESVVEYHRSPAIPDEAAIQAALMKQTARAPQVPRHTGPKAKPTESGKPLWNTPHSS